MTLFFSTLNQMAFLFLLIVIGYIVARLGAVPENASTVLSKLENNIFIPALVLGTFMENFTLARLGVAGQFFGIGFVTILITMPLAVLLARLCAKDAYVRSIYTYGLAFSNFGFMGNAVVSALFPDIFLEYLIFVLPFWMFIYLWGVPVLLIPTGGSSLASRLKAFLNPMFIAMLIGVVLGLWNPPLPSFAGSVVDTLGDCMSPVAMLLTGMTIARIDLKTTFKNISVYIVSVIRLLVIPLAAVLVLTVLPVSHGLAVCIVCSLAMPLGLNTIVVPGAYGKDTSVAAGMGLISHTLSCATIPLVFMVFDLLVK